MAAQRAVTRVVAISDRNPDLQQYERLIETLPIGYVRTTLDGEFRAMNSTFVAMVGGESQDDILSRDVEEFYRDPTTRENLLAALSEKGQVHNEELEVTTLSGETVWVLVTARVVETGDERCFDALLQDITDRRRREDVLREMHDIVSARDRSFEQQVEALLDLGRAELDTRYGTLSEIRGDDYVFDIVAADDDSIRAGDVVPVAATNCEIAASTEQTLVLGDVERDAPEETDRAGYTELGISCYIGAPVLVDDEVYGTFCFYDTEARTGQFSTWEVTLVDLMSRWVSSELQRRRANARLQAKNEQLEQFASIVSHDLRNPLNVARGRAKLAAEDCASEHLDAVIQAHDRMEALIDDLLTLAREGGDVGEFEAVALAEAVEESWTTVRTGDATHVVTAEGVIRADPTRLRQLLENLLGNAVEHGGDGVTVTVGDLPDGFYVADDGPGIPPENREDVFEAGYTTADTGTGFGLNIVREIVDGHGWDIRIAESEGGGTRFEVTDVRFAD